MAFTPEQGSDRVRLGTRSSPLARWQAEWVASRLRDQGLEVELIPIKTEGDVRQTPIGGLGSQGVFTKEIQRALLEGSADLAVHSLKDLPTEEVPGLALVAVPRREEAGDVLVSHTAGSLAALPFGARVGTGSVRRRAQLLAVRSDLQILDVRGNVDTRLQTLREGTFDALILAAAGLKRLALAQDMIRAIPKSTMLPAVGQGALGLETRAGDVRLRKRLAALDHADTHQAVLAERALLARLRGGCLAPVGAWARIDQGLLVLDAIALSLDGQSSARVQLHGPRNEAVALGQRAADVLLSQGAAEWLAHARQAPRG